MKYHYSHYWRTWNRVLSVRKGKHGGTIYKELNLTPIPCCYDSTWEKDVGPVVIREHCTMRDRRDVETDVLPTDIIKFMIENIGKELTDKLLNGEF